MKLYGARKSRRATSNIIKLSLLAGGALLLTLHCLACALHYSCWRIAANDVQRWSVAGIFVDAEKKRRTGQQPRPEREREREPHTAASATTSHQLVSRAANAVQLKQISHEFIQASHGPLHGNSFCKIVMNERRARR